MANALSSLTFFTRNVDKVRHGDVGRLGAVTAQGLGVLNKVSQVEGKIGTVAQRAMNTMSTVTESTAGVTAEKICNTAGKLVNPLLVAGAAIRVATSDDKEKALYKETAAMSTMFAAESLVKSDACQTVLKKGSEHLTSAITKGLEKLSIKAPGKLGKIIGAVVSAAALVGASIAAYDAGAKAGTYVIDKKRELSSIYATDRNDEQADLSIKS